MIRVLISVSKRCFCLSSKIRCNGVFDCENNEDERNCTSTAKATVASFPANENREEIYVSEGAIWTLVVSIIIAFLLVALIMWIKFKSDKKSSKHRPTSSDGDTDGDGSRTASERVAGIDRMRRQRNLNFERPESYHYSSRPNSMIYIGSQDNVRSISSQLSWYSQQLISTPRTPDNSPSFVDIPVLCPNTSIDHLNEEDIQSISSHEEPNTGNELECARNNNDQFTCDCERSEVLQEAVITPCLEHQHYNTTANRTQESELLDEREYSVSPPPTYSECNEDGIPPTNATAADALTTPPPTYTDSLSYNFITYV